jgi:hypothetical protein
VMAMKSCWISAMSRWNGFPAFGYCHVHIPDAGNPFHLDTANHPRGVHCNTDCTSGSVM